MKSENFWRMLPRPFFALAPMANVTDAAFRRIVAKYGKAVSGARGGPDIMWTEFVPADGLFLGDDRSRRILMKDLIFTDAERPIVAQFFTGKPEIMEKAAALAADLGFDGVDINMGCPDRTIEKQGAGAALMKDLPRAVALVRAARIGAHGLPVSVKTRIGYAKQDEMETWIETLLKENVDALAVHLRTRKEMSKVPAHWELLPRIVEIRDALSVGTFIIGNGDVMSIAEAQEKALETGADGIMLGKAIFGNPWLFLYQGQSSIERSVGEKLRVMVEHAKLFEELLGDTKNFTVMKKHFKAYVDGFPGAKELRGMLMEANDTREVEDIVETFLA